MVPEFAEAAFKLDKGAAVGAGENPVRLAHHQGRRQAHKPVPAYDQVKDQIETFVRAAQRKRKLRGKDRKARKAAKIERVQQKPEAPAAAPDAAKQK
jgi:peptidyl-prolyl cis-trans isomerase C